MLSYHDEWLSSELANYEKKREGKCVCLCASCLGHLYEGEEVYFNDLLDIYLCSQCYGAAEDYEDNKYHHVYKDFSWTVLPDEDEDYNPFSDI